MCSTTSSRTEKPRVVLLFGPTGVGKTALLDRLFSGIGEIVSADALQIYRDLDIGTAKPGADLLFRVPHHLIDIRDFSESFSIGEFLRLADECVADIHSRGMLPVISGGTAYYLRGWLMGLPETPPADPKIRAAIEEKWKNASDEALRAELERVDPVSAGRIGARDRYRMLRALEVREQTGRPLSDFPVPKVPRDDCEVLPLGLRRERADLNKRIQERVDAMFAAGLAKEVAGLKARGARREHPGMKAIGYREWFPAVGDPEPSEEEVRELIIKNTRRYAKRQMTFFASLPGVLWFDACGDPLAPGGIAETVAEFSGIDVAGDSLDQGCPRGHNP